MGIDTLEQGGWPEEPLEYDPMPMDEIGYQEQVNAMQYELDQRIQALGKGKAWMNGKGEGTGCWTCGGNHFQSECWYNPKGKGGKAYGGKYGGGKGGGYGKEKNTVSPNLQCFKCGENLYASECTKGGGKAWGKRAKGANVVGSDSPWDIIRQPQGGNGYHQQSTHGIYSAGINAKSARGKGMRPKRPDRKVRISDEL